MKLARNSLSIAVHLGIAVGMTGVAGSAVAQEDNAEQTLDRIEVTGSRIRQVDVETAQPVLSITRSDIESQGFRTVSDILQNITAAGSPTISRSQPLSSGEAAGGYYIDLRNLGANRTLILINGKRLGITTDGLQDVASIPTSIIERIDVLKDGASSVYGSDAMAGVVNIITRRNYDGAEANAYIGEFSQGDGRKQNYDFVLGVTGERGSLTAAVEYLKEEEVWAHDRWYSATSYPGYPQYGVTTVGQWGTFNQGTASAPIWMAPDRDGDAIGIDDFHRQIGGVGGDTSNTSDQMHVLNPLERRSFYLNGSYDISDDVRFTTDVGYNQRDSDRQIAGYPYQSTAFNTPMSAQSYFNPLGTWHGAETPRAVDWRRRGWEVPRGATADLTTWRFVGAFDGAFEIGDHYFNWDAGYLYNSNSLVQRSTGNFHVPNTRAAVGPSFLNNQGVVQCGTPDAPIASNVCVPWNPFAGFGVGAAANSLADPAVQQFLFPTEQALGQTETTSYFANLGGTLFALPAGDLAFAAGYEYRREQGEFTPDALAQSGSSTNLASGPTGGGYSIDEFYAELEIPLLADMPFARELTLNIASRYSDYTTFGDTLNSKVGLKWKPIDDLLVRGTWSEGFRAPTVDDLYGGVGESFTTGFRDPCDSVFGASAGNARCLQDVGFVPGGYRQLQQGFVPTTGPAAQTPVPFLSGSNPLLEPEYSTSKTLGFVYSPSFLEGANISVDWWNIRIENTVVTDSPNQILTDCYTLGIESRCGLFTRDPVLGYVNTLRFGGRNAGFTEVEGFDVDLAYRFETDFGRLSAVWNNTYVSSLLSKTTNDPDTPVSVGNSFGGNFRLRSNLSLGWDLGDFGATWGVRYYSAMKEACYALADPDPECSDPDYYAPDAPDGNPLHRRGSNTFHDVQFRWNAPWNATVSIGANNVTGHYGPPMYSRPNSNFAYYGGFDIGRFWYAKYQQRF